jgi:hypothetical protein
LSVLAEASRKAHQPCEDLSKSEKIKKLVLYFATLLPNKLDTAYEFYVVNATDGCNHNLKAYIDNFKK